MSLIALKAPLDKIQVGQPIGLDDHTIGRVKSKMAPDTAGPNPWGVKICKSNGEEWWRDKNKEFFKLERLLLNHEMNYLS